jgi:hypothetical protein
MMNAMMDYQMNKEKTVDDIMVDILMAGDLTSYGTPILTVDTLFIASIEAAREYLMSK